MKEAPAMSRGFYLAGAGSAISAKLITRERPSLRSNALTCLNARPSTRLAGIP